MPTRTSLAVAAAAVTLVLAGCAEDDAPEATDAPDATDAPEATDEPDATDAPDAEDAPEDDAPEADDGLLTAVSEQDFDDTVAAVEAGIEQREPLTLVTTVDHAANAEEAGLELEPTTLFVFGNPDAGTPLMEASSSVAIDLPQKLLVVERDGEVTVSVNQPQYLADRHDLDSDLEPLMMVEQVLEELVDEVTAAP